MQRYGGTKDHLLSIHLSISPFIHLLVHLCINWFFHPSAHLFIDWSCIHSIHSFIPPIQLSISSFIHLFICSSNYSFIPSVTHLSILSFTQSTNCPIILLFQMSPPQETFPDSLAKIAQAHAFFHPLRLFLHSPSLPWFANVLYNYMFSCSVCVYHQNTLIYSARVYWTSPVC